MLNAFQLLTKEDKKIAVYKSRFQTFKYFKNLNLFDFELISLLNGFYKKTLRDPLQYEKELERLNTVLFGKFSPDLSQQVFLAIDVEVSNIYVEVSKNILYKQTIEVTSETPEFQKQCFDAAVIFTIIEIEQQSMIDKNLSLNYYEIRSNLLQMQNCQSWEAAKSFLDNCSIGPRVDDKVEQPIVEQPIIEKPIVEEEIIQQPSVIEQKAYSEIPIKIIASFEINLKRKASSEILTKLFERMHESVRKEQEEHTKKIREILMASEMGEVVREVLKNREDLLVSAAKMRIDSSQEACGLILYLKEFPSDTSVALTKDFGKPVPNETVYEVNSPEEANKKIVELTPNSRDSNRI